MSGQRTPTLRLASPAMPDAERGEAPDDRRDDDAWENDGEGESVAVGAQMRRPMRAGAAIVLLLVVALLGWAALFRIAGAVNAPAVVRVENNAKALKSREGGVVRRLFVREGQRVRRGQILIQLDPVQADANRALYRNAYYNALANVARFQAEAAGDAALTVPAELAAHAGEPDVAALLASQAALFQSRMALYRSQATVLRAQAAQIGTQIGGQRAQMAALDGQSALIADELSDVRALYKRGYAPKTRLLSLERSAVELKGQRGALTADIARAGQAIGDVRLQLAQLDDKRQSDAADGLRQAQEQFADAGPKLRAATQAAEQTVVRAPADGFVFGLTQFTEGGVAQPGELLLQVVPSGVPLVLTARVRPADIASVHTGLPVRVTLSAFNPRTTPPVDGRVTTISADTVNDEATHESFYAVQVAVDPAALARAGHGVHLAPGMPASVSILTGSRTILDYLLGPLVEPLRTSLSEQ